jgi:hypothetical protein
MGLLASRCRLDNTTIFCKHPFMENVVVGMINKTMAVNQHTNGFRNKWGFEPAIYFAYGGLDLCPGYSECTSAFRPLPGHLLWLEAPTARPDQHYRRWMPW